MKYFLLLLATACGFAQNGINQNDSAGKKHGLWKGQYKETGRPRYEGTFDHGIETGTFTFYADNSVKSIMATRVFSDSGAVVFETFFDESKNVVSEGKLVNKLKEGEWKYYHKGSKDLMTVENYKTGMLNGMRKVFYKSGAIAEEAEYLNGKKDGLYKKYAEKDGIVLEESHYKNGQYNGYAIFRDGLGNLASQGNFVDGVKKGKWQFYENGKLKKEEILPKLKSVGKPKKK